MPQSRVLSGDTGSDVALGRLSAWLDVCSSTHPACASNEAGLPSRVVDVTEIQRGGVSGVKLVETGPGEAGTYVCLSHCWGLTPIKCCTTRATLRDQYNLIEFASLPKNFRDAVAVTRKLGIQFIWIDSLCIVQDDITDWEVESAKMATIYRNAYLTIAVAASADSTGGCFHTTSADLLISPESGGNSSIILGARQSNRDSPSWDKSVAQQHFPLFRRGWVFQERLLSRRVVYFGYGELAFECLETSTCECGNKSLPPHPPTSFNGEVAITIKKTHRKLIARAAKGGDLMSVLPQWREMVTRYMSLSLTKRTDILPALSGCARIVRDWTGDEYIAGMWKRTLHHELMWHTMSTNKVSRDGCWTAPSWSWASIPPGQDVAFFQFNVPTSGTVFNFLRGAIRSVQCEIDGQNDLGAVKSGRLEISARIFPCFIRKFCVDMESQKVAPRTTRYHLHVFRERGRNLTHKDRCCEADVSARESRVDLQGGDLLFKNDEPPSEILSFEYFKACQGCALAKVWLMRMASKEERGECVDLFMVLARDRGTGESGIFRRAGVMLFSEHAALDRKRWFDEIWGVSALSESVITIV